MTIHLFFLTITINKRKKSLEEAIKEEMVEQLYEKNKEKQMTIHRFM